jgi:hypothetical protein
MARTILHRFLVARTNIASFLVRVTNCVIDVCIIYYAHPLFYAHILHDFCDRALCDRALPLPTRKLTGADPISLLGVLKKGVRLYAKKRSPQYCIVF